MPVFNAERYIRKATESILNQTFGDFEFIIINDGSTDDSLQILEEYARKDARIRLVSRPNTGYTKALNEALSLARGPFVARMDADDVSMPDRFQKQIDYLRDHPECVMVGSRILMIDPFDSPLYEPKHRLTHEEIDAELLAGVGWAIVHPAAMMVREQLVALKGYRTEVEPSEDIDLFLRMGERGKLANLPDVLLHYRQHSKSVNHTRYQEQIRLTRMVIAEAYGRRGVVLPKDWTLAPRTIVPIKNEIDMWAWLALKNGNVNAARKHAMSLVKMAPFSINTWRLMFCAIRGH
jgi:glycosyltransferase involved in cell wall biosynthesis